MKNKLKLILDDSMTLLLLLMFKKHAISLMFHEVAGLLLIAIMAIHLFLNFAWVRGASKKIFSPSIYDKPYPRILTIFITCFTI